MNNKTKTFLILIFSLIATFIVSSVLIDLTGIGDCAYTDLSDSVHSTITRDDGAIETYDDMKLPVLQTGDSICFEVKMPEELPYEVTDLCFYQYHSEITVSLGKDVIYEYGEELGEKGLMYGDEYIYFHVPEKAAGKSLIINVEQKQGIDSDHCTPFYLMKAEDVRRFPLIGKGMDFLLFVSIAVISVITFFVVLIAGHALNIKGMPAALSLSMFSFCAAIWHLSYQRMLYVLCDNIHFASVVEYPMLFMMPAPLYFFFSEMTTGITKKFSKWVSLLMACLMVLATVADAVGHYHYPNIENPLYILFPLTAIALIGIEFWNAHRHKNVTTSVRVLQLGSLASLVLTIIQVCMIELRRRIPFNETIAALRVIDFSSYGLIVFLLTLVASYVLALLNKIREQAAEDQLKELAYVDLLTGIPNRTSCAGKLENLDTDEPYGIVFFDADGLKKANDEYGHEVGDKLITMSAHAISEAFGDCEGFFGRWGGDEFLAVFLRPEEIKPFLERFRRKIKAYNAKGDFPFEFTVSYGYAISNEVKNCTVTELRDVADERMYEYKKLHKKNRV